MEKIAYKHLQTKLNLSEKTIIVASAEWCGQCKMTKQIIEKLIDSYEKDIMFLEMDVEEDDLWSKNELDIKKVPTILFYKGAELEKNVSGYQYEETLTDLIKEFKNT